MGCKYVEGVHNERAGSKGVVSDRMSFHAWAFGFREKRRPLGRSHPRYPEHASRREGSSLVGQDGTGAMFNEQAFDVDKDCRL